MEFKSKAETLEQLRGKISCATILPQARFPVREWQKDARAVLTAFGHNAWAAQDLIVRSSSRLEDNPKVSHAGQFLSVAGVRNLEDLRQAVDRVVTSMAPCHGDDQFFIQPLVRDILFSGVAFSCDPNSGAPYIVINYDEDPDSACGVTSGKGDSLNVYYALRGEPASNEQFFPVIRLICELETHFPRTPLDVEFAVTSDQTLYLFQVRPLPLAVKQPSPQPTHRQNIDRIREKIKKGMQAHPYLYGKRTVYGIMPDWNPAEMIGVRPRPLALSLYKEMITDSIWAYQRNNYGYKNLRSFPLLISLEGLPYIDVRVSFNSFIPAQVEHDLAERLTDYYLDRLESMPSSHDKVEFDIVFSCYTPDIQSRIQPLRAHGFSKKDCQVLVESLRRLTNRIIHPETGLWRKDKAKIKTLSDRQTPLFQTRQLSLIDKIYWILEDCKRYGTLPFAGLARAAFISVQFLNALAQIHVLEPRDVSHFLNSLHTVGSCLPKDFHALKKENFLDKYGHLRPGTYDILSQRYDEAPERYFNWDKRSDTPSETGPMPFTLTMAQETKLNRLLTDHGLTQDARGLFDFFREAIEGREYAKFIFTRSISEALSDIERLGSHMGISKQDMAYLDIKTLIALYSSSNDPRAAMTESIAGGKRAYEKTTQLILPPLITSANEVSEFIMPPTSPNFITMSTARGWVADPNQECRSFEGAIMVLPSADPGYDWIFSRRIKGFITMYGGANSHMAIRALELGIPAVIGCGEVRYTRWKTAHQVEIDCPNKTVRLMEPHRL